MQEIRSVLVQSKRCALESSAYEQIHLTFLIEQGTKVCSCMLCVSACTEAVWCYLWAIRGWLGCSKMVLATDGHLLPRNPSQSQPDRCMMAGQPHHYSATSRATEFTVLPTLTKTGRKTYTYDFKSHVKTRTCQLCQLKLYQPRDLHRCHH